MMPRCRRPFRRPVRFWGDGLNHRTQIIADVARALQGARRADYLVRECGSDADLLAAVHRLLATDAGTETVPVVDPGATVPVDASMAPSAEHSDQVIDRYRLVELLGEGGFGAVWLAEQLEPVHRQVALKVIKLGMDTRQVMARFEAERQSLAMMDHDGIAKVYDAGATATGRPYFVMELVRGEPIVAYCDAQQIDTQGRLELFADVCLAIQHAHQKGVIHRDIKPSNVLVADQDGRPVPKVIDFGIAKATSAELVQRTAFTEQHQIVGTPAYMSPEQARQEGGDIDTRSDIYGLGVLLYELLVGVTPFDARDLLSRGYGEMLRIICEEEPERPSTRLSGQAEGAREVAASRRADVRTLSAVLRGDLDWIAMRCLEKERDRRYGTAAELAADIRRHLADQPVLAGPPGARYRVQKFVKRNRSRVVAAGLMLALLILGMVGTSVGLAWAVREKNRALSAEAEAEQRARDLASVSAFQASQLGGIDTQWMGMRLRADILAQRRSAATTDEDAAAALAGVNFTNVALNALDEHVFVRALAAVDQQFADQPLLAARLLQTLAVTMRELGLNEQAVAPQQQALAIRREQLGDDHPETLTSLDMLAWLTRVRGDLDGAEPMIRDVLALRRRILGDDHEDTIASLRHLSALLLDRGQHEAAEPVVREALAGSRQVLGEEHPRTLDALYNLGFMLRALGRPEEAEQAWREALSIRRRVFGDEHRDTIIVITSLGSLLQDLERHDEAEALIREAVATSRRALGDEHWTTLTALNHLGSVLYSRGDLSEAEDVWLETLTTRRRVLGEDHGSTLTSLNNLGALHAARGEPAQALEYYVAALAGNRRVMGDDHTSTMIALNNVGATYRSLGRLDEAAAHGAEAVATAQRVLPEGHWYTAVFLLEHARTLLEMGRFEDAAREATTAHGVFAAALGDDHPRTRGACGVLADLHDAWRGETGEQAHGATAERWRACAEGGDGGR